MPVPDEIQRIFDEWDAAGRPAQPTIRWQRGRWIARYPLLAATFNALPDGLNRAIVREIVLAKPATSNGMFEAMIATYAWGWSTTRLGVGRAGGVLNAGPDVAGPKLLAAREALLTHGPLAGYCALAGTQRVPGLGPAFGTKFLYFCSAEGDRALIIDRLVSGWLRDRAPIPVTAARWTERGYAAYLDTLSDWADELEIGAHHLEELIFGDEARRRNLPGWGQLPPAV